MQLELIEYAWNNATKNFMRGATLVLDPYPKSIEKMTKVEWRARHTGLYSLYPRAKYRFRRTVEFTLKGSCTPEKRMEIEFYAMRYSKFKIDSTWGWMQSPEYFSDRDVSPYGNSYNPKNLQPLYLMFTEASFALEEGKGLCTYTLKLQVLNLEGIAD